MVQTNPYKKNPFVYIDSSNDKILGFWRGSMADRGAFVRAEHLARNLGRNVHIVPEMAIPQWMKQSGAAVSKMYYMIGSFTTVTPKGEYLKGDWRSNPLPCPPYCTNPGHKHARKNADPRWLRGVPQPKLKRGDVVLVRHGSYQGMEAKVVKKLSNGLIEVTTGGAVYDFPESELILKRWKDLGYNPLTKREQFLLAQRGMQWGRRGERLGGIKEVYARARGAEASDIARMGARGPLTVSKTRINPNGSKKVTMSIQKFAAMLQKRGDPKMISAFKKKIDGYKKWTHGTMPKTVTLTQKDIPGVSGLWITYGAGKEPEALYTMPPGSKRKGAWKHPWDTQPTIDHDPEAGMIIKNLRGKSKITDFYHK